MHRRSVLSLSSMLALAVLATTVLAAPPLPYDETRDAAADVERARTEARASQRRVLLVFGANWCPDCRALDASMAQPPTAQLMAREFVVVKVDVGRFDRNLPLAERYGNPIKKGIPAAVIVAPDDNTVLYATRAGELSNARRMSDTGVHDFFRDAAAAAR